MKAINGGYVYDSKCGCDQCMIIHQIEANK